MPWRKMQPRKRGRRVGARNRIDGVIEEGLTGM